MLLANVRAWNQLLARRAPSFILVLALSVSVCSPQGSAHASDRPAVCDNHELREAMRVIQRACVEFECRFSEIKDIDGVDKSSLMAALRDPTLKPVHLFFPRDEHEISDAFDWTTIKRDQLDTVQYISNPKKSAVFVIGRASSTGDIFHNRRLSAKRMRSILMYIKDELHVECDAFYGGYVGKEHLQLGFSDADLLNVDERDFRDDALILNQSVHVFVFPCADEL